MEGGGVVGEAGVNFFYYEPKFKIFFFAMNLKNNFFFGGARGVGG